MISLFGVASLVLPATVEASIFGSLLRFFGFAQSDGVIEEETSPFFSESRAAADTVTVGVPGRVALASDAGGPVHVMHENAYVAPLNPNGSSDLEGVGGGQIFFYRVRSGDTLSTIAKSFDVSVNTILWANSISNPRALRVGEELLILPVTGVKHEVKKGDTVASIAKKYGASVQEILDFNGLDPDQGLALGTTVIVPDGEIQQVVASAATTGQIFAGLPVYGGYYTRPIIGGRRSRGIHGYNGVDLANSRGLPVFASAAGTVIIARGAGWNGGYGNYIVISHPNNTQTLYAHLLEGSIAVSVGQTVRQGDVVGAIGSTGNSTGYHIHFEVRGAKNPF